jgi:hypothetical protein
LAQYNKSEQKAIFKETTFIREAADLWEALFVYDCKEIKNEVSSEPLPEKLTEDLLKLYKTHILS